MKSTRGILIIVLMIIVGGFFLIRSAFFEKQEFTRISNRYSFQDSKKSAEGIWLFKRMLEADSFNVENVPSFESINYYIDSSVIINFSSSFFASEEETNIIFEHAENGNTILLSSYSYRFTVDSIIESSDRFEGFNHLDLFLEDQVYSFRLFEKSGGRFGSNFYRTMNFNWDSLRVDTILYADLSKTQKTFPASETSEEIIQCVHEHVPLLECHSIGMGRVCFHYVPYLFTNIASEQGGFRAHYQAVLESLGKEDIVFIDPNLDNWYSESDSPLQHILKEPSFKWAYYLSWMTALIFLFIGSKRINLPIPVRKEKTNDLIGYVRTMSLLFQKADANQFIGGKIEENFYKYVREKYFINKEDPDFWERLIVKSQLEPEYIFRIRNNFEHNRTVYDYSEKVLRQQDQLLEKFYKKSQEWSINNKE